MTSRASTVSPASPPDIRNAIGSIAASLERSGIADVASYGRDRPGVIPLWIGEGDTPTPDFVRAAATASLEAGETFYTGHGGIPALREAIARYMSTHYGAAFEKNVAPFTPDRFFVTIGGMHALQIAIRLVTNIGDEVALVTPAWPNFTGALAVAGVTHAGVPLHYETKDGQLRWSLDIDDVARAVTPRTKALLINTPANPTGWTATYEELQGLLAIARRHGLWIIADEIYGRIVYEGVRAPSFHDIVGPDDKIVFVQTMSKNWAMTGLRVGWLEAPPALGEAIENLVHYSTSGVAVPWQRAAIAAIQGGEPFFAAQMQRLRQSRDILRQALAATGRVRFADPVSTFYLFCAIEGVNDVDSLPFRLIDEAGIGVAPGYTFGRDRADHIRICFAREPAQIAEVTRRLVAWLG